MSPDDYVSILKRILQNFVKHPDAIEVIPDFKPHRSDNGAALELLVRGAAEDQGRLIGAEGRNAMSFQTIMRAIGKQNDCRIFVQVLEPSGPGVSLSVPFTPSEDEAIDREILDLIRDVVRVAFPTGRTIESQPSEALDVTISTGGPVDVALEASLVRVFRGIARNRGREIRIRVAQV